MPAHSRVALELLCDTEPQEADLSALSEALLAASHRSALLQACADRFDFQALIGYLRDTAELPDDDALACGQSVELEHRRIFPADGGDRLVQRFRRRGPRGGAGYRLGGA